MPSYKKSERIFWVDDDVEVSDLVFVVFIHCFHGLVFGEGLVLVVLVDVQEAGGGDCFEKVLVEFL